MRDRRRDVISEVLEIFDTLREGPLLYRSAWEVFLRCARFCMAVDMALREGIDPQRLPRWDRERVEEDPSWQDGWDAAMDFVSTRVAELMSTDDEGRPWPASAASFRHEKDLAHRRRSESYRKP